MFYRFSLFVFFFFSLNLLAQGKSEQLHFQVTKNLHLVSKLNGGIMLTNGNPDFDEYNLMLSMIENNIQSAQRYTCLIIGTETLSFKKGDLIIVSNTLNDDRSMMINFQGRDYPLSCTRTQYLLINDIKPYVDIKTSYIEDHQTLNDAYHTISAAFKWVERSFIGDVIYKNPDADQYRRLFE
jgi:hypothetical protein